MLITADVASLAEGLQTLGLRFLENETVMQELKQKMQGSSASKVLAKVVVHKM